MPYSPTDFKIEQAKVENKEEYLKFIDTFFSPREQMGVGLGVPPKEWTYLVRMRFEDWLSSRTSTVAIYTPINQLAGISFTTVLTRENPITFDVKDAVGCSENFHNLMKLINKMEKEANLFQDPKVDKILEIAATGVNPEFSGMRLTYRMAEESEKLGKALGCQMVTSQSTNIITQHVRQKMGLEQVVKVDYESLEIEGKKVMDMSRLNESTCALVLRKYL